MLAMLIINSVNVMYIHINDKLTHDKIDTFLFCIYYYS